MAISGEKDGLGDDIHELAGLDGDSHGRMAGWPLPQEGWGPGPRAVTPPGTPAGTGLLSLPLFSLREITEHAKADPKSYLGPSLTYWNFCLLCSVLV